MALAQGLQGLGLPLAHALHVGQQLGGVLLEALVPLAGGGGFLQVVMKKGVRREQLRQRLEARFPGDAVKVWDCTLI